MRCKISQFKISERNRSHRRSWGIANDSGRLFRIGELTLKIGGDQGFFDAPVELNELLLAPAERADIIVDFSTMKSTNLLLFNNAPAPYGQSKMEANQTVTAREACTTSQIMKFRVRRCIFDKVSQEINLSKLTDYANPPIGDAIVIPCSNNLIPREIELMCLLMQELSF